MKCHFCQDQLYAFEKLGQLSCKACNIDYYCATPDVNSKMFLYSQNYCISIDFDYNQTELWVKKLGNYSKVLTLNYIIDVNPANIKYWIDRLNNLKAFS
jgi:hypothetical protein